MLINEYIQCMHKGSPPPQKAFTQCSAVKIMATIFWGIEGILLIEYSSKGTDLRKYFQELHKAIYKKRRHLRKPYVFLVHDNAPVHMTENFRAIFADCDFTKLNYPPYSSDLAPSDNYLFRNLK